MKVQSRSLSSGFLKPLVCVYLGKRKTIRERRLANHESLRAAASNFSESRNPKNFTGRASWFQQLVDFLKSEAKEGKLSPADRMLLIEAEPGVGKSTFVSRLLQLCPSAVSASAPAAAAASSA